MDTDLTTFMLDVLSLVAETDCYGEVYWSCHDEYGPITFFVTCNDLFWWASADSERIMPEDMPALRRAIADVYEIDKNDLSTGFELWCARKRGMRPQQPAYPKNIELRALFDACGPERSPKDEG